MNVYQRLNEARTRFHATKLTKTGENTFAKYKYFELGDFLVPALRIFQEMGLCAVVSFDADKACMLIRNVEKPDEYITIYSPMGSAQLKGCHEVQNIGAVETYQRRYLWVAALEIVEHDALDATTGSEKAEPEKEPLLAKRPRAVNPDDPITGFSPAHAKIIRAAAGAAIQAFNEGNEWGAYEEVVACLDTVGKATDRNNVLLALSSIFQPYSALRSSLKKHMEAEREKQKALTQTANKETTA